MFGMEAFNALVEAGGKVVGGVVTKEMTFHGPQEDLPSPQLLALHASPLNMRAAASDSEDDYEDDEDPIKCYADLDLRKAVAA